MMDKNDGGPAFPHPALGNEAFQPSYDMSGMSLRDWFAGQALSSIYMRFVPDAEPEADDVATQAYIIADAMLEARK